MFRDIFKQMLPFFILLGVLWVAAELLERTLARPNILAPPLEPRHAQP